MALKFNEAAGDTWHLADGLAPHYCAVKRASGVIELWTADKFKQITVVGDDENWTARQLCKLAMVSSDAFAEGVDFGDAQARREILSLIHI